MYQRGVSDEIKEFLYFLKVAHWSGAEVETQLLLAHRPEYIPLLDFQRKSGSVEDVMRMLSAFIKKLQETP